MTAVRVQGPAVELVLAGIETQALEAASATLHAEDIVIGSLVRFTSSRGSLIDCRHRDLNPPTQWNEPTTIQTNSDVVLSECQFAAGTPWSSWIGTFCVTAGGGPGVVVSFDSRAVLTNCVLSGGTCGTPNPPSPAFMVHGNSTAVLTDCTLLASPTVVAIRNTGPIRNVLVDHGMVLSGPPSTVTRASVPGLGGFGARPGGTMQVALRADPQRLAAIAASFGARPPVPSALGLLWLDPNQVLALAVGITDPNGSLTAALPVPPNPTLRGALLTVQGVALSASGAPIATTPSVLHVR